MQDLLFNTPWWLPTTFVAAGVILFLMGNARQRTATRNLGGALILVGIGIAVVSWLVETPKELTSRETREIVHAVEHKDWPTLNRLLDEKTSLSTVAGTIFSNRKDLVVGAKSASERWSVGSVVVTSLTAVQTQSAITIHIDLLSTQDATMGRPLPSSWEFDWEQNDTAWHLQQIICLKIGNEEISRLPGLIR